MNKPLVFMVPGQGTQYPGMAQSLYTDHKGFRRQIHSLLETTSAPLTDQILAVIKNDGKGKETDLSDCRLTHPLIFVVHYALAETLKEEGIMPDFVFGYSLGELTSLAINGSLSSQTALQFAIETGRWIAELTPERQMMAILASPEIQNECYPFFESITLACHNFAKHFVITGTPSELKAIAAELRNEEVHHELLPINRGFHSAAMDPFTQQAAKWSSTIEWQPSTVPLISCAIGNVAPLSALKNNHLGFIHRQPVRFSDTFQTIEAELSPNYVDLSTTGTMAAFARQLVSPDRRSAVSAVQSRFGDAKRHFETFLSQSANL